MFRSKWLWVVVLMAGCPGSDSDDAGKCMCEAKPAVAVAYDKKSSMLGADNVQDAIDELAARPVAESAIGPRLMLVEKDTANTGAVLVSANADCPDPIHDVALGGACTTQPNPGTTLVGTLLGETGYGCSWRQSDGSTDALKVTVRCLRNAR